MLFSFQGYSIMKTCVSSGAAMFSAFSTKYFTPYR